MVHVTALSDYAKSVSPDSDILVLVFGQMISVRCTHRGRLRERSVNEGGTTSVKSPRPFRMRALINSYENSYENRRD